MKKIRSILAGIVGAAVALAILLVLHSTVFRQVTPAGQAGSSNRPDAPQKEAAKEVLPVSNVSEISYDGPIEPENNSDAKPASTHEITVPKPKTVELTARTARPTAPPTTQPTSKPVELSATECMRAGDRALAEGKVDEAVGHFQQAVDMAPKNVDAWRGLAMAMLAAETYKEAIPVYRELLKLSPDDAVAKFNLALALAREAKFLEAENIYLDLLEQQPDSIEARSNLAMMYQAQSKLASARKQWLEVIKRSPKYARAHAGLGEVYMDLQNYEEAMLSLAEAAKLQPKNASAWLNMASAAKQAGSGGRALYALQKSLALAPEDSEAWAMLGDISLEIYRVKNKPERIVQAVSAWQNSLKFDPDQPRLKELVEIYGPTVDKLQQQKD